MVQWCVNSTERVTQMQMLQNLMNIHKTFGNLWKNKENDDADRLLLEAPDKVTKEKYAFHKKKNLTGSR